MDKFQNHNDFDFFCKKTQRILIIFGYYFRKFSRQYGKMCYFSFSFLKIREQVNLHFSFPTKSKFFT